jgi:hypothetical protein
LSKSKTDKTIKGVECRFAVHCKSKTSRDDLHLVKELVTYEDGTQEPRVKLVQNYQRPVYITKKGKQTYKDFKEWEKRENLDEFHCTQATLTETVARGLGQPWFKGSLRDLCASPYVFGADITASSLIKQEYHQKYPVLTPYSLAVFDTETDVIHGHGQIMIAGLTFKNRVFVAVQQDFVKGYANAHERILELCQKYLGEIIAERKITIELKIVPTEIDIVRQLFTKAHEWKPDWLVAWNMVFDVEKVIAACQRAEVPIEDILSDPAIPPEFRFFRFKKGPSKKVMASGRILNFKPSQQWHSVLCPSSFYWMDAMCAYRQVRQGAPEEQSYALDAILKKNKLGGKLKFEAAAHLENNPLDWHKFMQAKYPLEYVVYNIYDCIGVELLDEQTKDLQLALPSFAEFTDFQNFNSLPRKTMNELHFFVDKFGRVPGSTASEMANEMDEMTTDVKGWIVMLPSHLIDDNGLQIVEEHPTLRTNIRIGVADLDIEGAYPTNELVINVSKETTSKELVKVTGVPDQLARLQTINFSGGKTNAIEFATTMYGMPPLDVLLQEFKAHLSSEQPTLEEAHDSVTTIDSPA